jgi:nucleoid DNA-binding protein
MSAKLSVYISELLYEHDCVILPGFGGFVARNRSASFNNGGNLLSPPQKAILFNQNLKNNDGLLANNIMEKDGLSYTDAIKEIELFVKNCTKQLQKAKRLELKNVGVFYMDTEKNLQFEPQADVNYLLDAYGLFPILTKTITQLQPETTDFVDRKTIEKKQLTKKQKRFAMLAIAFPALALGAFLIFNQKQVSNFVEASFGISSKKETTIYSTTKYTLKEIKYMNKPFMYTQADANGFISFKLTDTSTSFIVINTNDEMVADKTAVKSTVKKTRAIVFSQKGNFNIVIGCFSSLDNATRLVNSLNNRNISAGITGKNKNGLHVVSAGIFDDANEARMALDKIRVQFPAAWLMKNN